MPLHNLVTLSMGEGVSTADGSYERDAISTINHTWPRTIFNDQLNFLVNDIELESGRKTTFNQNFDREYLD